MDRKKRINSMIHKINQSYKLQIIICVVLCMIVIGVFYIINTTIPVKYDIRNDITLINQIEKVNVQDKKVLISGYAFSLNMDSDNATISILLRNVDIGKEIWANVEHTLRNDVNSYFYNDFNYENSGFIASIKNRKLETDVCYEIVVKISYDKNDSKTVSSNRYIMNGELYSYNPIEFNLPDMNTESKLLQEVFNNGRVCLYNKNEGMYVYQYKNSFYWIVDEKFSFDQGGITRIPYHLYTSEVDISMRDKTRFKSISKTFNFEENEYKEDNTSPYRIVIKDIPDDYPIAYITTGVYDTANQKWFWDEQFHLYHDFR